MCKHFLVVIFLPSGSSMGRARAARTPPWRASASARAVRAQRRTLWRAGARCVGTRGECCALWHGVGASCPSRAAGDRDVFINGSTPPSGADRVKLNVCCGDEEAAWSDFRQPCARAFWWDNWHALSAESREGCLTHWHVYCGACEDTCVLCDECGCDAASSVCASCRRMFG